MARSKGFALKGKSAIPRILEKCTYAGLVRVKADKHNPEKFVKSLHQPIIRELDYWRVQEKLGNRKPCKVQPKDDFPLRGIINCWCGRKMTAGYSKGKYKYYMYYRCLDHGDKNYTGEKLHTEFEEILSSISLSEKQLAFIKKNCKALLDKKNESNKLLLQTRIKNLEEVDNKIEKLEERLINEEIEGYTYKR